MLRRLRPSELDDEFLEFLARRAVTFVDADGKPRDDLVAVPMWTPEDEKAWRDAGKPTEP